MNRDHEPTPIERWADAVRADERADDGPSEATDDAVLHYARAAARPGRAPRTKVPRRALHRVPRVAIWSAAAVVAAIAVLPVARDLFRPSHEASPHLARDFNADGRVDVLDAQALARGLARGDVPAGADVDASGAVDQDDVDTLLRAIVRLPGGAS